MASVTYIGPHDEVEIPSLGVVVKHGETFEVDDAAAASLLEQAGNFKKASASKSKGE